MTEHTSPDRFTFFGSRSGMVARARQCEAPGAFHASCAPLVEAQGGQHWLAIMRAPIPLELPHGVCAIPAAGLVALTIRQPALPRGLARQEAVLRATRERQECLQALMQVPALLPASGLAEDPGTGLEENADEIHAWLERLSGRAQVRITVSWDLARAATRFEGAGDFGGRARTAAHLAARMTEILAPAILDAIPLPVSRPDVMFDRLLLVERGNESLLAHAASRIDAIWSKGFDIHLSETEPAAAFAQATFAPLQAADPTRLHRLAFANTGRPPTTVTDLRLHVRRTGHAAPITPERLPSPGPRGQST